MKTLFMLAAFLCMANFAIAQQNKWLEDEKNILTVTITDSATKTELRDLKKQLWDTYQIRFDLERVEISENGKKLKALSLRVEVPSGHVGTVSTDFIKSKQVIGFHYDRNDEAYDVFGVWTK